MGARCCAEWPLFTAALIVLVGCAQERTPRPQAGQSEASTLADAAPAEVADVVCERDSLTLENPLVRAQRDGVHVTIENRGGVWGFEFRSVADPNSAWNSGPIGRGTTSLTDAAGPGEVLVACLRKQDDDSAPTARLRIVDPDDLYVPWEPACGFGEQFRMKIDAADQEEPAEVFRRVAGVKPSDEFRTPKYPESPQYAPTVMVFRDGVAVARIMAPRMGKEWELLINSCPGSGIAKT